KIYNSVLEKERKGAYLGSTVQVIPHVTDEIKSMILKVSKDKDITIVEIGGTVGDIESLPFLEAIRQLQLELGKQNTLFIHLTYVPYISVAGELKTKPTQHSVKELRAIGIQPDIIICRSEVELPQDVKSKIAMFCNVKPENVISAYDVDYIYKIPLILKAQNLDKIIIEAFNLEQKSPNLSKWEDIVSRLESLQDSVNIAIVGKYIKLKDAYKSLIEALIHGGIENKLKVNMVWLDSENVEEKDLEHMDGILIPGGFGERGIEGKIKALNYGRTHNIPTFGICLGMQLMAVEFARNVLGFKDANSTEFDPNTPNPVIDIMEDQKNIENMGGTMRLGAYECLIKENTKAYLIKENTKAYEIYQENLIYERHRHRYEFNNKYKEDFEKNGFIASGIYPKKSLVEILELKDHRWYIGCQFHPEFKSKPFKAHKLFASFIENAYIYKKERS
ncbi:MAG: CTP synthetase, partial [Hydrogenobaculum sp.]